MAAPPRYVMLDPDSMPAPPPSRRNLPHYHQHDHHSGCNCMKCFCCCYCCFFILILLTIATLGLLVFFLDPKLPYYAVDNVSVKNFDMKNGSKLYAEVNLVLKAENPNEDIIFEYGKNSSVNITYSNNQLCTGQLPAFKQPLDVKVKVLMTIVIHGTRLKEVPVAVKFKLTVNSLQPGEKINAVASDFEYVEEA